jgi:PmbA protein
MKKNKDFLNIANRLLKNLLSKGIDEAAVEIDKSAQTQIKFVNSELTGITSWDTLHANIFAVMKKRVVATRVDCLDNNDLRKAAQKVRAMMTHASPNEGFGGLAQGPFKYHSIKNSCDTKIANIGDRGIDICEASINVAAKEGASRVSGNFDSSYNERYLVTSGKVELEERGTHAYLSIRAIVDKDATGHKTACSRMLGKLDYVNASKKAARYAVMGKNPIKANSGKQDIVFDPMGFAVLLDNISHAASAFSVESGMSFFNGMIGKDVAANNVSLFDDGTIANGFGSRKADDEGTPIKQNAIIKDGKLMGYLHNHTTSKRYVVLSTGNAGLISPEPWNTFLQPGRNSSDKLIKGVDKGLYITNIWYTRYQNHATGDFSTIPRDSIFLIRNGRLHRPVKGIRISDNMVNVLKSIRQISNSPEQVFNWETEKPVTTPFVLVSGIKITKSE